MATESSAPDAADANSDERAGTSSKERPLRFHAVMSDAEALMWQIESDPWLNPSGGVVVVLDRPADPARFRLAMGSAVAANQRLFERVVTSAGRLSNPRFEPDAEFDLDWHVRRVALGAPGSDRQLLDLAAQWMSDPYDRTRPLWQFLLVEGLSGGRGAVLWKLHHTLMDGKTAVRLTESFTDIARDAPVRAEVDLRSIVRGACEASAAASDGSDASGRARAASVATSMATGPLGVLRSLAAEAMLAGSDPERVSDLGAQLAGAAKQVRDVLAEPEPAGSALWAQRSRHRRAEAISLPLDAVAAAAKRLGGTVNDVFVAGLVEGVVAFHANRRAPLDALRVSFIVSTRTKESGANAFAPSIVSVPVGGVDSGARFEALRERMRSGRSSVASGSGLLDRAASIARLLPTSTITELGRRQASSIDFATSNLRGAPAPLYVAGAKMLRNITLGPVAGTAFNATALSMATSLDIGLHLDAGAIDDPAGLVACVEASFDALLHGDGKRDVPGDVPDKHVASRSAPKAAKAPTASKAPKSSPRRRS